MATIRFESHGWNARLGSGFDKASVVRIADALGRVWAERYEGSTVLIGYDTRRDSKRLAEIAGHRQIISVTHLPQIAAYGDDNYLISKSIDNQKSYTNIDHLDDESKVRMIAALFSGSSESENALEAARELIASAK